MAEPTLQHQTVTPSGITALDPGQPAHGPGDGSDAAVPRQYARLIGALVQAERELDSQGPGGRGSHLEEASSIVFNLLYALDFRRGGELAPRLAALYGYIGNELLTVGRTGDRSKLASLRDLVAALQQSWYEGFEAQVG